VTGLDYFNARYYDPVSGQFLSADVVQGNAQGTSPYMYVMGNPETRTDPTGQMITCGSCGSSGPPNANDCAADPSLSGCSTPASQGDRWYDDYQSPPHYTNPCPNGGSYCEAKDKDGEPVVNRGKSALRGSGISGSDSVSGKGAFGLDRIITDLQQALLWLITQPLATLLNPNNAAVLSGIFGTLSTLAALSAALIDIATEGIATGAILAGTLLSATFGAAGGVANIKSGEGPGSQQIIQLEQYVNGIIRGLQDFAGALKPSLLENMVFTLTEVDTYPVKGVHWISVDGGFGQLPRQVKDGYFYDFNTIASAQFTISFEVLS